MKKKQVEERRGARAKDCRGDRAAQSRDPWSLIGLDRCNTAWRSTKHAIKHATKHATKHAIKHAYVTAADLVSMASLSLCRLLRGSLQGGCCSRPHAFYNVPGEGKEGRGAGCWRLEVVSVRPSSPE